MQAPPLGKILFPTPPGPNAPDLVSATFANRRAVVLPDEIVTKILMYLDTTHIAVCRGVDRYWQALIDTDYLLARSFYRDCHLSQRINSAAVEHNLAVDRYLSHIRGWLTDFSDRGRKTAEQLDNILEDKRFPAVLFFSITKLLLNSNELTYESTATIRHSGTVRNVGVVKDAIFSPNGKYLVTISTDNAAKLSEFVGGHWREKVTLRHSAWVSSASFSLDGNHLVTGSGDGICKIWGLEGDQWQEKDTLQHSTSSIINASFCPDGKHLMTVCDGESVKIWRLGDHGQWQEKATLVHYHELVLTNAQFSPDGKHLSTSVNGIVKIWALDDGQWKVKFIIPHPHFVTNTRFSPDGKHFVTVTTGDHTEKATLWELVDVQLQEDVTIQQWQEKAIIQHVGVVNNAHFSPDGKHLVTASRDGTVKICGLESGNWQVIATIQHFGSVENACFSHNGKFLVTASHDHTAKICGHVGGEWQEIVTIEHSKLVTNAHFGPDDYQFVTACSDDTAKVWVLKNKENDDDS